MTGHGVGWGNLSKWCEHRKKTARPWSQKKKAFQGLAERQGAGMQKGVRASPV